MEYRVSDNEPVFGGRPQYRKTARETGESIWLPQKASQGDQGRVQAE